MTEDEIEEKAEFVNFEEYLIPETRKLFEFFVHYKKLYQVFG